ncbi:MAG: anaerobic sulfite reductase subunit AsrB [Clostridiales bacterium]|uniref:anaerobic sulfite reductase subunit AsrB n=1 Tax=Zhenhengia sp. TaxID=2944208 RepID=UPI00290B3147|nr:anaerobic sulfite reductase subunit AsrB [Clostridiales bacterium]
MHNELMPVACQILEFKQETQTEFTIKVATGDLKVEHGQFCQLSIPKIGECPISVSDYGDGWMDFTIRAVGKVTDEVFKLEAGDQLFIRGAYGKGWPVDQFKGKNVVIIAGGTGVAPVKSMINQFANEEGFAQSVNIIAGFKDENGILFKDTLKVWEEKFNTIYTLDRDEKEGFRTGLVTKFIEEIPFKDFGDNYEVVIVGPPIMMHFAGLECVKQGIPEEKIWVSFERKMSCAIGKCGHCRIDETYVCLEGPVFNYTQAKKLID